LPESDFEKLLLLAVDLALSSLGESSKQAIYGYLDKNFSIKKHEIPIKIELFKEALEKVFGVGASFLEVLIMKRLYEAIGGDFEWEASQEFTFTEYVATAKRAFIERKQIKATEAVMKCEEAEVEV
jgi:hypothetical protein